MFSCIDKLRWFGGPVVAVENVNSSPRTSFVGSLSSRGITTQIGEEMAEPCALPAESETIAPTPSLNAKFAKGVSLGNVPSVDSASASESEMAVCQIVIWFISPELKSPVPWLDIAQVPVTSGAFASNAWVADAPFRQIPSDLASESQVTANPSAVT